MFPSKIARSHFDDVHVRQATIASNADESQELRLQSATLRPLPTSRQSTSPPQVGQECSFLQLGKFVTPLLGGRKNGQKIMQSVVPRVIALAKLHITDILVERTGTRCGFCKLEMRRLAQISATAVVVCFLWRQVGQEAVVHIHRWPECAALHGCTASIDGLLALNGRVKLTMGWCHATTGFAKTQPRPDAFACAHVTAHGTPPAPPPPPADALPAHVHFVGCARDVAPKLSRTVERTLDDLGAQFTDSSVLIFENDSRDATRERLLRLVARSGGRVSVLLGESLSSRLPKRTARLAHCRGTLLSEVRRRWRAALPTGAAARDHYMVVLDLDCKRPVEPQPLRWAVAAMQDPEAPYRWSVLTANSKRGIDYYDLWALRSATLGVDYDCWHDAHAVRQRGSCDAYEVRIDPRAPVLPVESAFNGLAVYSLLALWERAPDCTYDGDLTCEHVPFHLCLRSRGLSIGVAPYLVQGCGDGAPRHEVGPPAMRVSVRANSSTLVDASGYAAARAARRFRMRSGGWSWTWWDSPYFPFLWARTAGRTR